MFELSLFPKGSLEQISLLLLPINRGNCHWSLGVSDHRYVRLYTLTIIILFERLTNTVLQSYQPSNFLSLILYFLLLCTGSGRKEKRDHVFRSNVKFRLVSVGVKRENKVMYLFDASSFSLE